MTWRRGGSSPPDAAPCGASRMCSSSGRCRRGCRHARACHAARHRELLVDRVDHRVARGEHREPLARPASRSGPSWRAGVRRSRRARAFLLACALSVRERARRAGPSDWSAAAPRRAVSASSAVTAVLALRVRPLARPPGPARQRGRAQACPGQRDRPAAALGRERPQRIGAEALVQRRGSPAAWMSSSPWWSIRSSVGASAANNAQASTASTPAPSARPAAACAASPTPRAQPRPRRLPERPDPAPAAAQAVGGGDRRLEEAFAQVTRPHDRLGLIADERVCDRRYDRRRDRDRRQPDRRSGPALERNDSGNARNGSIVVKKRGPMKPPPKGR